MTVLQIEDFNAGTLFDFNGMHAGYYKPCVFTAFGYVLEAWRLAGVDEEGMVHLYYSFTGSVWKETSLEANTPYGLVSRPQSGIISILGEEAEGQIYLICEDGEIVILPDI